MAGHDEIDYEALAAHLTDPETEIRGLGEALHGEAAAAAGRAFLVREYGSEEALEAALKAGRPRLGERARKGRSPVVRGRVTDAAYAALKQLEEATGESESKLVRDAIDLLLREHKLAS